MACHRLEAVPHAPHPVLAAADVRKNAKDALAAVGTRRKCVHVQTGIVLAPGNRTAYGGLGPEARACALDIRLVAREKRRDELCGAAREAQHERCKLGEIALAPARAFEGGAVEADVFRPAVGPLRRQEAPLPLVDLKAKPWQNQNAA